MNVLLFQSYISRRGVKFPTRVRSKFVAQSGKKLILKDMHELSQFMDADPKGNKIEGKIDSVSIDQAHTIEVEHIPTGRDAYSYKVSLYEYGLPVYSRSVTLEVPWGFPGLILSLNRAHKTIELGAFKDDLKLRIRQRSIYMLREGNSVFDIGSQMEDGLDEIRREFVEEVIMVEGMTERNSLEGSKNQFIDYLQHYLLFSIRDILMNLRTVLHQNKISQERDQLEDMIKKERELATTRTQFAMSFILQKFIFVFKSLLEITYQFYKKRNGLIMEPFEKGSIDLERLVIQINSSPDEYGVQYLTTIIDLFEEIKNSNTLFNHEFSNCCLQLFNSDENVIHVLDANNDWIEEIVEKIKWSNSTEEPLSAEADENLKAGKWWRETKTLKIRANSIFDIFKDLLLVEVNEKYRLIDTEGNVIISKDEEIRDTYYVEKFGFGFLVYTPSNHWESQNTVIEYFNLEDCTVVRKEEIKGSLVRKSVQQEHEQLFIMLETTGEDVNNEYDKDYKLYCITKQTIRSVWNQKEGESIKLTQKVVWEKRFKQTKQEIHLLSYSASSEILCVVQNSGVLDLINRNLDYSIHLLSDLKDLRSEGEDSCKETNLMKKLEETSPEKQGYRGSYVSRCFVHRNRIMILCSDAYDSHRNLKTNRIMIFRRNRLDMVYESQYVLPAIKKDDWYYPVYLAKYRYVSVMILVSGTSGYRLVSIWRNRFNCAGKSEVPLKFEFPKGCGGLEDSGHIRSDWIQRGKKIQLILSQPKGYIRRPDCFVMELKLKL